MERDEISEVQEWVETQSIVVWPVVLVGGIVLFAVAQRLAQVSATTLQTTPTVILVSLIAIVSFVVSMVALALAVWGLTLDLRGRDLFV